MLIKLIVVIIKQGIPIANNHLVYLYNLNMYNSICQLFPNKAGNNGKTKILPRTEKEVLQSQEIRSKKSVLGKRLNVKLIYNYIIFIYM